MSPISNQTEFTDYHKFNWQLPKPPLTLSKFTLKRILYFPLVLFFWYVSSLISMQQKIIIYQELTASLSVISTLIIAYIFFLDFHLSKKITLSPNHYSISLQGIAVNKQTIPFSRLSIQNTSFVPHKHLILIPKKFFGKLKLQYQNQSQLNQINNAIKYYQSNQ